MIKRIDHVSLAVRDREAALKFFVETLDARNIWSEEAPGQGFHWTLLEVGDTCLLEIIDPSKDGKSFLEPFLESRGDGAHHITFHVDDIAAIAKHLEQRGVPVFGLGEPYPGWKELFVHPRHAFGVLLQFAEFDPLQWAKDGMSLPPVYQRLAEERRAEAADEVVQLGDPRLRIECEPVEDFDDDHVVKAADQLKQGLRRVREALGFGRGIAAPQLGMTHRMIAVDLGDGPQVLYNPVLTSKSDELFTMWDDCLSFPWLRVRLERHASVTLSFLDEKGTRREWSDLDRSTSELLQHELDHLDGVLALDRAIDRDSVISRKVFEANLEHFRSLVDECDR